MKYIVLLIFLFSPTHIQGDSAEEALLNKTLGRRASFESMLKSMKNDLASTKAKYNELMLKKQNYSDILQQEKARTDDLKRNHSELQKEYDACDKELKQCEDRIQNNMSVYYQQEIQETEKRIQKVLREKNDKIPLSQKQKDEKEAALNQLNDEKSKLNKLKSEKERLLREIEKCQTVPESSTVLVPESSTSSGSTCFLNNFIDYKSSLLYNLLSGLLGLARRKS